MNAANRPHDARREEIVTRCRQERAELAGLAGAAAARLHRREFVRAVRWIRAVLKIFAAR